MNADSFDPNLSLTQRWKYSQNLAHWLNKQNVEDDEKLSTLKKDISSYFTLLKRMKLKDDNVYWKQTHPEGGRAKELMMMILLFPLGILGLIHCGPLYFLVKRFAEKSFKRNVFWASVKVILGKIGMGLINIPVIFLFYHFVYESWGLAILYYALIGIFGLAAYEWFLNLKSFKTKGEVNKANLEKFIEKRKELIRRVEEVLPAEL